MTPYARRATLRGLSGCSHVSIGDVRVKSSDLPLSHKCVSSAFKGFVQRGFYFLKKKTTTLYNVLLCAFVCAGRMQADHGTSEV